jgi:ectoine hydroxylase-related dioxygenase (phytanoyl-CoA dioxygenase family)
MTGKAANHLNLFGASATTHEILPALETDGYAIIEGVLDGGQLAILSGELAPHVAETPVVGTDFSGHHTRRFGGVMAKSAVARDLALNPIVMALADHLLLPYCARYQLSFTGIMHLDAGESAQALHRDTECYPFQHPAPPTILSTMWAASDFTSANGATCLVPGSHHWDGERRPEPYEIISAEMAAGSVLVHTGNIYHGSGANLTDAPRLGVSLQYSLGWLRQVENQYLAMSQDQARTLPKALQELMGYALAAPFLGSVNQQDPNEVLNRTAAVGQGDLAPAELLARHEAVLRLKVTETRATGVRRHNVTGG